MTCKKKWSIFNKYLLGSTLPLSTEFRCTCAQVQGTFKGQGTHLVLWATKMHICLEFFSVFISQATVLVINPRHIHMPAWCLNSTLAIMLSISFQFLNMSFRWGREYAWNCNRQGSHKHFMWYQRKVNGTDVSSWFKIFWMSQLLKEFCTGKACPGRSTTSQIAYQSHSWKAGSVLLSIFLVSACVGLIWLPSSR